MMEIRKMACAGEKRGSVLRPTVLCLPSVHRLGSRAAPAWGSGSGAGPASPMPSWARASELAPCVSAGA